MAKALLMQKGLFQSDQTLRSAKIRLALRFFDTHRRKAQCGITEGMPMRGAGFMARGYCAKAARSK